MIYWYSGISRVMLQSRYSIFPNQPTNPPGKHDSRTTLDIDFLLQGCWIPPFVFVRLLRTRQRVPNASMMPCCPDVFQHLGFESWREEFLASAFTQVTWGSALVNWLLSLKGGDNDWNETFLRWFCFCSHLIHCHSTSSRFVLVNFTRWWFSNSFVFTHIDTYLGAQVPFC